MDFVRSCYTVNMRFKPGGPLVMVRWYYADSAARAFPDWHGYSSMNWDDDKEPGTVGEDRTVKPVYSKLPIPARLKGDCPQCPPVERFNALGDPSGYLPSPVPVGSDGVPLYCVPGYVQSPCCPDDLIPPTLSALVSGDVVPIRWNSGNGMWTGEAFSGLVCPITNRLFVWLRCRPNPPGFVWEAAWSCFFTDSPLWQGAFSVQCNPVRIETVNILITE